MRAMTSVVPPAAKGTMIVTGRDGKAWAVAGLAPTIAKASAPTAKTIAFLIVMDFPPCVLPAVLFLRRPSHGSEPHWLRCSELMSLPHYIASALAGQTGRYSLRRRAHTS